MRTPSQLLMLSAHGNSGETLFYAGIAFLIFIFFIAWMGYKFAFSMQQFRYRLFLRLMPMGNRFNQPKMHTGRTPHKESKGGGWGFLTFLIILVSLLSFPFWQDNLDYDLLSSYDRRPNKTGPVPQNRQNPYPLEEGLVENNPENSLRRPVKIQETIQSAPDYSSNQDRQGNNPEPAQPSRFTLQLVSGSMEDFILDYARKIQKKFPDQPVYVYQVPDRNIFKVLIGRFNSDTELDAAKGRMEKTLHTESIKVELADIDVHYLRMI